MSLADYIPVLIQIILALLLTVVLLSASIVLGQRSNANKITATPYECGINPEGTAHPRFSIKFYVTAMLFLIFDIEVVFLIPWATIYKEFLANGIPIYFPILFFFFVLVTGLIYELKQGALDWER